jgi:hypothetical protein
MSCLEADGLNAGTGEIFVPGCILARNARAMIQFDHRKKLHFLVKNGITDPFRHNAFDSCLTRPASTHGIDQSRHRDLREDMALGKYALQAMKKIQVASRQHRLAPIARLLIPVDGKP